MNELMISQKIHYLPNRPAFMLARDLAEMYQTTTKRIAEQVRRNPRRFPEEFCFRLTRDEAAKCGVLHQGGGNLPLCFTHDGANALASVLRTPFADERMVMIAKAFTRLEQGRLWLDEWQAKKSADPLVAKADPVMAHAVPMIAHRVAFEGLQLLIAHEPQAGDGLTDRVMEMILDQPRGTIAKLAKQDPALKAECHVLAGDRLAAMKPVLGLRHSVNVLRFLSIPGCLRMAALKRCGSLGRHLRRTLLALPTAALPVTLSGEARR